MARHGLAGRAQGACRQSWGYNYLATASADSGLKPSRSHSARRALCDREGGGWWHVRPRMLCVPPRKSVIRDFSAQTPYGDSHRVARPMHPAGVVFVYYDLGCGLNILTLPVKNSLRGLSCIVQASKGQWGSARDGGSIGSLGGGGPTRGVLHPARLKKGRGEQAAHRAPLGVGACPQPHARPLPEELAL